jgi:hypothetical protein
MWFIGDTVIFLLALTGWGALLMLFGLAVNQDNNRRNNYK